MHNVTILIAGHGNLAAAIQATLADHLDCIVDRWENAGAYTEEQHKVIVHIGSGRQLPDILAYCNRNGTPLIQGSTGLDYHYPGGGFTVVEAANFNILLLKFMHMLKQFGKHFRSYEIQIVESHQETKTSVPGTAVAFSEYFGVDVSTIRSIRNRAQQLDELGIAAPYLDRHAVHILTINDGDTTLSMRTQVLGLASYVSGLASIVRALPKLEKRFYNVVALVELGLI